VDQKGRLDIWNQLEAIEIEGEREDPTLEFHDTPDGFVDAGNARVPFPGNFLSLIGALVNCADRDEVDLYLFLEECEPDGDGEADDTPETKVCAE
jgi:hypothetical protein